MRPIAVNFVRDVGQEDLDAGRDTPGAQECFAKRLAYLKREHIEVAMKNPSLPTWRLEAYRAELERRAGKAVTQC